LAAKEGPPLLLPPNQTTMKIAMFSYNAFVSETTNGWKGSGDKQILLIQDPQGRIFATTQSGISTTEMANETKEAIDTVWDLLAAEISTLDKFVIYVGSHGAEYAIELARKNNIPAEKLLFVFCDCGTSKKMAMIKKCNYEEAKIIDCECGGEDTMSAIYEQFLETGELEMAA
jgi:hypothetical protein